MKWRGISESVAQPQAATLRERLTEIRAGIAQYVRPENQAVNERAIAELAASGIMKQALPVGTEAPEFTLPDQHGRPVSSRELLADGKLIFDFFRGRWCPFCITELEVWREKLPQIEAGGAKLVAISPQKILHNSFTADQHKLNFPLLSDEGNKVARSFGLVYRVPEYQKDLFKTVFINLPNLNGDDSWELPLPATYVIGSDGRVVFASLSADYRERAEPDEVLAILRS